MSKVKLTQEQARAIEKALDKWHKDEFIYRFSEVLHRTSPSKHMEYQSELYPLNDMALHEVAKAIYVGYEVPLKAGDWASWVKGPGEIVTLKILGVNEQYKNFVDTDYEEFPGSGFQTIRASWLRHATDEEKETEKRNRWWANHNRKVWELHVHDILYYAGDFYEVTKAMGDEIHLEFVERSLEKIRSDEYYVACFAEDRKDIKQ